MIEPGLKLTTYFGERDRAGGGFLADALADLYARRELPASVVLRGVEGFGAKQRLHTDRLLTLSEDLPLVCVAVAARERVEGVLDEVVDLFGHGLISLERARILTPPLDAAAPAGEPGETAKLTLYLGRHERAGRRPAHVVVTELLHRAGVAGVTVLLGVDGTMGGRRERARFFGSNTRVPVMVLAVGPTERLATALAELGDMPGPPLATLERVQVCKRDGRLLARPRALPAGDRPGVKAWSKLTVYSGEQARHDGRPLHRELVRRLRGAGAIGATALRGVWGYHGDHEPHGDSLRRLRRRVPVVTVVVDRADRALRWFDLIDELTAETGLVTSELVPASRITGPGLEHGGLGLAVGR